MKRTTIILILLHACCTKLFFQSRVYNNATLYIPKESKIAYSQTAPWNKFKIASIPTSIKNIISGNNTLEKVNIYTIDGKLFKKGFNFSDNAKELPSNMYIINGKKYFVKLNKNKLLHKQYQSSAHTADD